MATMVIHEHECEVAVKPGLCGRVWLKVVKTPAEIGGGTWGCAIPGDAADAIADAIECGAAMASGSGEYVYFPFEGMAKIVVRHAMLTMTEGEAKDVAKGIRKALAWKEAHP